MNTIYVLLFTWLLYVSFGTILDAFIASKASTRVLRIKTKVFFHTYVAPIMFSLVFLFVSLTENKTFNIFLGCALILGSIIRIFSTRSKYLTEFQIDDKNLTINYVTQFLKPYSTKFSLIDVSNVEVTKANWLVEYPAAVNVEYKGEWTTFEIIDKKLKAEVQRDIDVANIKWSRRKAQNEAPIRTNLPGLFVLLHVDRTRSNYWVQSSFPVLSLPL